MAGVVDLLQRGYAGIETRSDALWLNPCLPDELVRLKMVIRYRGHALDLTITQDTIDVHALPSNATPITIGVVRESHEIAAGERRSFLTDGSAAPRSAAPFAD
jgi:alpha,alpha-trehalase